ncbi:hypothetical protein B566_EDAN017998 [Ephemera danica]|nr:hypothetical protein B566_EDAN017998 [Ephemera danica]
MGIIWPDTNKMDPSKIKKKDWVKSLAMFRKYIKENCKGRSLRSYKEGSLVDEAAVAIFGVSNFALRKKLYDHARNRKLGDWESDEDDASDTNNEAYIHGGS